MNNLPAFLDSAWALLAQGVAQPGPARFVSLATLDEQGAPRLRTVALRAARRDPGELEIHTDLRSDKIAGLRRNNRAEILLWDPQTRLQIRASGTIRILRADDTPERWQAVPIAQRGPYGHMPAPGTPIPAPDAFAVSPDPANYAVLILTLDALDLVDLQQADETAHRRAVFQRSDSWRGQWLSP